MSATSAQRMSTGLKKFGLSAARRGGSGNRCRMQPIAAAARRPRAGRRSAPTRWFATAAKLKRSRTPPSLRMSMRLSASSRHGAAGNVGHAPRDDAVRVVRVEVREPDRLGELAVALADVAGDVATRRVRHAVEPEVAEPLALVVAVVAFGARRVELVVVVVLVRVGVGLGVVAGLVGVTELVEPAVVVRLVTRADDRLALDRARRSC